jgi:hypothetical protein
MAYMSQAIKAQIEPNVKKILKKYKVNGRLSVKHNSTLVLTVKSGEIDFIKNCFDIMGGDSNLNNKPRSYIDVNVYNYHNSFDSQAYNFINEVYTAMMNGNWDNSEPQFDHFDKGWYVSIHIGKWDKPYILVK